MVLAMVIGAALEYLGHEFEHIPPGPGHRPFLGSKRPSPPRNPPQKVRAKPPTFSGGFWGGEWPFGSHKSSISVSEGCFLLISQITLVLALYA